ncbi:MAG: DUF4886 domain-containing protein [Oscillospiraceae bacterium]|nr:DUF4886 domain-containing protein [Oscillospiraceae bacterium]
MRTKRVLSFVLSVFLLLPVLAGCKDKADTGETKPAATEPAEEAAVLKVLTLGHSLTVDACHMLNLVAAAEGYESMLIGTLYYSGCSLSRHVELLQKDEAAYELYLSSTDTPGVPPEITKNVTMKQALNFEYWDIIIMQGATFELTESTTYTNGDIQIIKDYVNAHKANPLAVLAWHMPWAIPTDPDLLATQATGTYTSKYTKFDNDRSKYFSAMAGCVKDHITTDKDFMFVLPTGTAIENALSSYLTEKDLHRDYGHATDIGRLIAAYTYFCCLTGTEQLEEVKLDKVPKQFFKSIPAGSPDWVLTDHEKEMIIESVNNALKEPLKMTQSKFTEKPAV